MIKVLRVVRLLLYKLLYFFQPNKSRIKLFPEEILKKKRVIIIGPAESSLSYMSGLAIDDFDFIVRVNKAPHFLKGLEDKLGSRTDILYHCFSEDPINGGGIIDFELLKEQKNKYIVYSYSVPELETVFYKTVLKYKSMLFYRVRSDFFSDVMRHYPAKWPTTGLQAILHLMSCDFKELHITGFTFFRTGYVSGYTTNKINESEQTRRQQIEQGGSHSFDGELQVFKEYYARNKHKNIYIDSVIESIIS